MGTCQPLGHVVVVPCHRICNWRVKSTIHRQTRQKGRSSAVGSVNHQSYSQLPSSSVAIGSSVPCHRMATTRNHTRAIVLGGHGIVVPCRRFRATRNHARSIVLSGRGSHMPSALVSVSTAHTPSASLPAQSVRFQHRRTRRIHQGRFRRSRTRLQRFQHRRTRRTRRVASMIRRLKSHQHCSCKLYRPCSQVPPL